jgi:MoxR-like ATPase
MSDDARERVRRAVASASEGLVDRRTLLEVVALAAVAREHVLVLGPPGTAKSEGVRRIARALGGRFFEYLLGRFTEPSEIFGPVDLRKLRDGTVETETRGMLPEAEIAFLDEVFLGSTAILNTLLGILNERRFRRGHTDLVCPLRVCVGASNTLPEEEQLAAFADRFLLRVFVEPMPDPRLEELLEGGWALRGDLESVASVGDLDVLAELARALDLGGVRADLAHAIRLLRKAGVSLTDRRIVKAQSLVAAAAVLSGRSAPTRADLWPLVLVVPTREGQELARDVLAELLSDSDSAALGAAALDTSRGPRARARQLEEQAVALLEARPQPESAEGSKDAWLLRIEGLLRTIDASVRPADLPASLATLRAALAVELPP